MFASHYRLLLTSLCLIAGSLGVSNAQGVSTLAGEYRSIAVSGDRLIGLDSSGLELLTSDDDGQSFQSRESLSDLFHEVAALGTTAAVVGIDGLILRSTNSGSNWSSASAPYLAGGLYGVAARLDGVNANKWLAVGDDGFDGSIYRSTDNAATWTEVEVLTDILLRDVVWTGTRWLVCGRDIFLNEGVVYSSTDGLTWSASTLPVGSAPLLALAHSGAGVVLAVGEEGQLLRSTDDGLSFSDLGDGLVSGDLNAVVYLGGTFYAGGAERAILEVDGADASVLVPPAPQASEVDQLIVVDGSVLAVGEFEGVFERTLPFDLILTEEGTEDYRLTITETLSSKTYFLQTSSNLKDWDTVEGTSRLGNGSTTHFDVSIDEQKRFWRAIEF